MSKVLLASPCLFALLMGSVAYAQQQGTPSQIAIRIDNVINGWAQMLEGQGEQIADLKRQLAAAIKDRDEFKAKCEVKPADPTNN